MANDVYAEPQWLRYALEDYAALLPDGGLLGFGGDGHAPTHACHFLIGRTILEAWGGWPVWYHHTYGDTELCQRAHESRCYAKSERAILEHRHPIVTGAPDDAVYAAGRAEWAKDEALYYDRLARGWK